MAQRYKAKWKFAGDASKKQLAVNAGDVLDTASGTARAPKGWLLVRSVEGKEGFIPEAYVEKLAAEDAAAAPSAADTSATLEDFLKDELDEAEAILAEVSQDSARSSRASGAPVAAAVALQKQTPRDDEEEEEARDDENDTDDGGAPLGGGRGAAVAVAAPVEERRHFNKTKWAFNGDASKKQLTTQKGEEVEILRCYMQLGWSFARRLRDSEKGFVPNNYLESIPDESLAELKWQVGDCCLAQAVSGDWRRGRVMDVGEKTCRVRFEDGSEKLVGSLGITPDTREDEMPAPLMLPKPTSLKRGEFAKHKQQQHVVPTREQLAVHRNSAPTIASPAALPPKLPQQKSVDLVGRNSSSSPGSNSDAMWEALRGKIKSPKGSDQPAAAAVEIPASSAPAAAKTTDPNKLWEMLQNKVLSPKSASASPLQTPAATPPPPSRFQLGDAVWVCNLEDKWTRGEIVGTSGANWEVVVEATGDMLIRPDNLVRPAKAPGQQVVVVQQVVRSSDTASSASGRNSEEDFDDQMYAAGPSSAVPISAVSAAVNNSLAPTIQRRNSSAHGTGPLLTMAGTPPIRTSTGEGPAAKSTPGVASWSAANAPRRASQGVVNPNDFALVGGGGGAAGGGGGANAANNGRVVSDAPVPIYTMDGGKRTMMLTPKLTANDIVVEILQRWKMESHAGDCVLVSVVRDEVTVVRDALPLTVKGKWPLIVSSNKSELPKCRFVVRCKDGASPKLREFLGDPLPNAHNLKTI